MRRVRRQHRRPLEERGGRGEPASCAGAGGRLLQLLGDVLVRPARGVGEVPGAAIGIDRRIGDVGQRPVRRPALH